MDPNDLLLEEEDQKPVAGKKRSLTGRLGTLITVLTVSLAAFQLYTAFFGLFPAMQQRSLHMAFVLPLIFII